MNIWNSNKLNVFNLKTPHSIVVVIFWLNASINVKPKEGGGGGADVGHLTFCEIFFSNSLP